MKEHFTPAQQFVFWIKSRILTLQRYARNFLVPVRYHKKAYNHSTILLHEIRTPLYTETNPNELGLQLGKIENLRVAARTLDQIVVKNREVFSFWRQIGRPTRAKGFVTGRELRQGCIIPTIAGGICQLSNSLYQVAKCSGMEIVERHGHTQQVEGAAFKAGEDATVFWNYVDFRFRATRDVILVVKLTQDELIIQLGAVHGG